MCSLQKALCAVREWRHILKNCSVMGVHLCADSLVLLPLIHYLHDQPSVEAEKPQLSAFPCFMIASALFCVPANDKAVQHIVFNKCSIYFWSEDLVKKSKEISFSPENSSAIIPGLIIFQPLGLANKMCGCCWTTQRKVNMINAELFICGEMLSMGMKDIGTRTTENVIISPKWDKHRFSVSKQRKRLW